MAKVLVTGGAGFIGSHVVDTLIDNGFEVVIVDNMVTGNKENLNPKAKLCEVDITSDELDKVFMEEKPDFVCHQAAQVNVRKSVEDPMFDAKTNVIGSINILECCKKHNVKKVVYASSGGARYGEPSKVPCDEKEEITPLCQYGITKHTVEHYIWLYNKLYGLPYVVLAYGNVYGPRQDPKGEAGVICIFLTLIFEGKDCKIFGDGDQTRDYVYVGDVARANLLALQKDIPGEDFNIGTGVPISVNDIVAKMKEITGKGNFVNVDEVPGEVRHIHLDISKAKEKLGWTPEFDFDKGLRETVKWFEGKLNKSS